ncbi:MAG TPA: malic enzyme-like NAD(P)-binding protein, partial [Pyrinomonadaceae bacterium]|nr:malic enzyme-like NAD(P)-binding protein [Pyrinomonadaceae bacterium]
KKEIRSFGNINRGCRLKPLRRCKEHSANDFDWHIRSAGRFHRGDYSRAGEARRATSHFPLSNPTSKSEATPEELTRWTNGRALIATGSPFPPISHNGRLIRVGQCNNAFIFPGVGLGVIASGARRVTEAMFSAAARVLSEFSPAMSDPDGPLFPPLEVTQHVSYRVALAVGTEAVRAGLASISLESLEHAINEKMWTPHYVPLKHGLARKVP